MTKKHTLSKAPRYLLWAVAVLAPSVVGAKGCDVAVVGSECGGLSGTHCGSGQFCELPANAACGAADVTGTCTATPTACPAIFAPVCGCDDKTYGNSCQANAAGVSVASDGACESTGKDCGGLANLKCAKDEFCNYAADAMCGAADATGTCAERPDACPEIYAPVCGCDDKTYGNACEANAAGTSVASDGACGSSGRDCGGLAGLECAAGEFCNYPQDALCGAMDATGVCAALPTACDAILAPVCGCDGNIYDNACLANAAGTAATTNDICGLGGNNCGPVTGICVDGEFCNFDPEDLCGVSDYPGTCTPTPEVCMDIYSPVCGCDNQTYGNACEANAQQISVAYDGECGSGTGGSGGMGGSSGTGGMGGGGVGGDPGTGGTGATGGMGVGGSAGDPGTGGMGVGGSAGDPGTGGMGTGGSAGDPGTGGMGVGGSAGDPGTGGMGVGGSAGDPGTGGMGTGGSAGDPGTGGMGTGGSAGDPGTGGMGVGGTGMSVGGTGATGGSAGDPGSGGMSVGGTGMGVGGSAGGGATRH